MSSAIVTGIIDEVKIREKSYAIKVRDAKGNVGPVMYKYAGALDKFVSALCERHGLKDVKNAQNYPYLIPGAMFFGTVKNSTSGDTLFLNDVYACPPDETVWDNSVFHTWMNAFMSFLNRKKATCNVPERHSISAFLKKTPPKAPPQQTTHDDVVSSFLKYKINLRNTHILSYYSKLRTPLYGNNDLHEHLNIYAETFKIVRLGHDVSRKTLQHFSIKDIIAVSEMFQLNDMSDPVQMYVNYIDAREHRVDKYCLPLVQKPSISSYMLKIVMLYNHWMEPYLLFQVLDILESYMIKHEGGGHTCMSLNYLCKSVKHFFCQQKNESHMYVDRIKQKLGQNEKFVAEVIEKNPQIFYIFSDTKNKWVYMRHVWEKEAFVAAYLESLMHQVMRMRLFSAENDKYAAQEIQLVKQRGHLELTGEQEDALSHMLSMAISQEQGGVFCLTGLPGTGKSFVLNIFKNLCTKRGMNVFTCAPSGKAARRTQGMTIHRFIRQVDELRHKDVSEQCLDEHHASLNAKQVVILDEVSMLDIQLAYYFLDACKRKGNNMYIIFAGDPYQLAPIGHGNVLGALLDAGSESIPHHFLTEVKRQTHTNSMISKLARSIIDDHHDTSAVLREAQTMKKRELRFVLMKRNEPISRRKSLIYAVIKKYYERYDDKCMILSPKKDINDPFSTTCINKYIHDTFYARDVDGTAENQTYATGERVFVTKNVSQKDGYSKNIAFNGELGYFEKEEKENQAMVYIDESDVNTSMRKMTISYDELDYGHACTVHRMQGSDHPIIIMIIDSTHKHMLTKQLLYTAVTRAKDKLVLLMDEDAFLHCEKNDLGQKRIEMLSYCLKNWNLSSAGKKEKNSVQSKEKPKDVSLDDLF